MIKRGPMRQRVGREKSPCCGARTVTRSGIWVCERCVRPVPVEHSADVAHRGGFEELGSGSGYRRSTRGEDS